jgi:hypothetical protein
MTYSFPSLEEPRVDLSEQLQDTSGCGDDTLVLTLPVFDQITEQVLLHTPRLSPTDLSNSINTSSDNLGTDSGMNEFLGQFSNDWRQDIGRCKLVHRLSERDEDKGDLELMVGEVLDDV